MCRTTVWQIIFCLSLIIPASLDAQSAPASGGVTIAKAVGTIKSVQTDSITISAESGGEVTAKVAASTKVLQVSPEEKDLMKAVPIQLHDLQPGDRVLVRGQASPDPQHIAALAVIVMKQADVSAKQQRERDDWQKRGVGGLVTKVDAASGTIAISAGGVGTNKSVIVHVAKDTILRRYAPGSVKFDDAKPAPLDQIKVGDQLRARGTRSADGSELTAEEIVTGTFRNIAGIVTTIDPAANSVTVKDLIAKSPVTVKISSDSQMKKLPSEMAQRIAARLKGGSGASGDTGMQNANAQPSTATSVEGRRGPDSPTSRGQGGTPGGNGNSPPDFQRMLSRLPNSTLPDLQKGDAVMIVATESGDSGIATVITLVAGVDAILTASPNRAAYSLLSPWSLNPSGGSEGEAAP